MPSVLRTPARLTASVRPLYMSIDLLDPDLVNDRKSFVRFVHALIADREDAERLEKVVGGTSDWQNSSISTFLECALAGAEAQRKWGTDPAPSWKDLAIFLYLGKIYE